MFSCLQINWIVGSLGRGVVGSWGRGVVGSWSCGVVELRSCGVVELLSCGVRVADASTALCIQLNYYFSVGYYFIQDKAGIAESSDNEFILKVYLCMTTVYVVSLYASITDTRTHPYQCRLTQTSLV